MYWTGSRCISRIHIDDWNAVLFSLLFYGFLNSSERCLKYPVLELLIFDFLNHSFSGSFTTESLSIYGWDESL